MFYKIISSRVRFFFFNDTTVTRRARNFDERVYRNNEHTVRADG